MTLAVIFAPGFFASAQVHTALIVAVAVCLVTGPLGVFTVIRGQSFAGEAMGDIGTTGGAGAFLAGAGPLGGFVVFNVVAAILMQAIGIERRRGRDLATGVVLGAGLGVAALLFYLVSTVRDTTGTIQTVLFGSLFAIERSTVVPVVALAVLVLIVLAVIARPLLLGSVSPELAMARGVPVRLLGTLYLLALALTVALCALTIGSILATALLIGPAAAALRVSRRPGHAAAVAVAIGVAATWIGVVLSYDSYDWPPHQIGWPVSFFVVCLVFVIYLACGAARGRDHRLAAARQPEPV